MIGAAVGAVGGTFSLLAISPATTTAAAALGAGALFTGIYGGFVAGAFGCCDWRPFYEAKADGMIQTEDSFLFMFFRPDSKLSSSPKMMKW